MLIFARKFSGTQLLIVCLAYLSVLVISLSLHEFSHAYIAYKNGDYTPKQANRVTLNPLAHIEPIGFISCLLFGFGWAKPVPINPINFRNIRKGLFWVSVAGVLMNIILAFIACPMFLLCEKYFPDQLSNFQLLIFEFFQFAFIFNICLFVFNLLPIYPLDGFNILQSFCKYDNKVITFLRVYGPFILIGVLLIFQLTNIFSAIIYGLTYPILAFWSLII